MTPASAVTDDAEASCNDIGSSDAQALDFPQTMHHTHHSSAMTARWPTEGDYGPTGCLGGDVLRHISAFMYCIPPGQDKS